MAEKSKYRTESSVYWTNIAKNSADEDSDAFVPGLSSAGNRRPGRVKGRKTKEVKAKVPMQQPLSILETVTNDTDGPNENNVPNHGSTSRYKAKKPTHDPGVQKPVTMTTQREIPNVQTFNDSTVSSKAFQSFAERSIHRLKQASLKDLRPEDKQRVANLIKELRVGEEKEKVVQELHGEPEEQYEKHVMTMVEQQERILAEREDIQEKLFQCQKLLTEYQAQLLNRQDRLNSSIAEIQEELKDLGTGTLQRPISPIPAQATDMSHVNNHASHNVLQYPKPSHQPSFQSVPFNIGQNSEQFKQSQNLVHFSHGQNPVLFNQGQNQLQYNQGQNQAQFNQGQNQAQLNQGQNQLHFNRGQNPVQFNQGQNPMQIMQCQNAVEFSQVQLPMHSYIGQKHVQLNQGQNQAHCNQGQNQAHCNQGQNPVHFSNVQGMSAFPNLQNRPDLYQHLHTFTSDNQALISMLLPYPISAGQHNARKVVPINNNMVSPIWQPPNHGNQQEFTHNIDTVNVPQGNIMKEHANEPKEESEGQNQASVSENKAPFIRQHLTERQPRARIPDYKPASEIWANRNTEANDSVTDLLLNSKDPRDCVKRPFTSMIDKEIARERSLSRGSQGSSCSRSPRSRSGSPSEGRPKFAYPEKLINLGPLHDPVASSTHKSVDIRAQISNFDQESVRSLSQRHEYENGGQLKENGQNDSGKHGSKVAFTDKDEYNDEAEMHSPNLKSSSKLFNDPDYAKYYKKLSPGGRKRELLKQRQALLLEQDRLREVLEKQERQLKDRQSEYQKRQDLQKERMEFYQKDGKFPAFKLNFDDGGHGGESTNESEAEGSNREQEGNGYISDAEINNGGSARGNHVPQGEEKASYEKYSPRGKVEIGTSPLATPTKLTKATSPARSPSDSNPSSQRSQGSTSQKSTGSDGPRLVDVATSVSYRTPLKDASNRQGNLTLAVNRHKSSPPKKSSSQPESLSSARSVGDKEESMDDDSTSMLTMTTEIAGEDDEHFRDSQLHGGGTPTRVRGYYDELENEPLGPASKYTKTKTGSQFSPLRQYSSPVQTRTSRGKLLEDPEESIEENKILEDIFFL